MADSAFSDDGKYFSSISHDGRLKIWDTETNVLKQEFTPDLHLSSPPSCLQWILTSNTETPRRKIGKKRSASFCEQQDQCIALGTSNGRILIYSISEAKVVTVLEDAKNREIQNAAVTALDWHKSYGLFSSNKEGYVYDWDLSSGAVRYKYNVIFDNKNKKASSVSAIKIIPHSQPSSSTYLVTASWQVRLWQLTQGALEPVRTLGHSGQLRPVLALVTLEGQKSWLIEGSQNERLLSFWDVTIPPVSPQHNGDSPSKQSRQEGKEQVPSYRLVLEELVRSVHAIVDSRTGLELRAAAVTRSGVLHYYGVVLNGSTVKPIKPTVTVQVTTPSAALIPVVCGACHTDRDELVVGYQTTPGTLHFERITPDTSTKTQVLIRGSDTKGKSRGVEPNSSPVHYLEPMGGVARKRAEPGAKVEVSMETRLSNLALDTNSRSKSAVNQNLTKLLVQGLHSNDKQLIQMVLREEECGVSVRTLTGLPPRLLPRLLAHLTELASGRTQQCLCACRWTMALCKGAAATVAAAAADGDSQLLLARLLAVLTQRRSQLCQLLNLKGRLDLTIAQRGNKIVIEDNTDAILTYNDDTSSEDEMQVECPSSDSGGEEDWAGGGGGMDETSDTGGEDDD